MRLFKPDYWLSKESIKVDIDPPKENIVDGPAPSIVLIHGAHQSNTSFEFVRHALPGFQYINIDWHTPTGFQNNLNEMIEAVQDAGPVYLVGHSMGGIYAAHLSEHVECIGGAAISTPWHGSKAADWFRYMFPNYPLYKEVGTKSPFITKAREMELQGEWTNYVTTRGDIPGYGGPNDCVLTIDSMSARPDLYQKTIEATHYEVVLSPNLIHSLGKNFLRSSEKYQSTLDK